MAWSSGGCVVYYPNCVCGELPGSRRDARVSSDLIKFVRHSAPLDYCRVLNLGLLVLDKPFWRKQLGFIGPINSTSGITLPNRRRCGCPPHLAQRASADFQPGRFLDRRAEVLHVQGCGALASNSDPKGTSNARAIRSTTSMLALS